MSAPIRMGDRVKVTLEGEVTRILDIEPGSEEVELRVEVNGRAHFVYTDTASVEKVAPPAEVFGPGDVVRNPKTKRVYTLAKDGWVMHGKGAEFTPARSGSPMSQFTSDVFERVQVG